MNRVWLFFILLFYCGISAGFIAINMQNDPIVLHYEKFKFIPQKFYIVNIADGRVDRSFVALMIKKHQKPSIKVDLKNGAVFALKNYLDLNLRRDTTLSPVLVTIKELKIIETDPGKGEVSGDFKIVLSFSSQLSYQNKHLVDFNKEIHYRRPIKKVDIVEADIRAGINDGITFFNNWINQQRAN